MIDEILLRLDNHQFRILQQPRQILIVFLPIYRIDYRSSIYRQPPFCFFWTFNSIVGSCFSCRSDAQLDEK